VDGQVPIKGALADEIVDQIVTEEILEVDLEIEISVIEETIEDGSKKDFKEMTILKDVDHHHQNYGNMTNIEDQCLTVAQVSFIFILGDSKMF